MDRRVGVGMDMYAMIKISWMDVDGEVGRREVGYRMGIYRVAGGVQICCISMQWQK